MQPVFQQVRGPAEVLPNHTAEVEAVLGPGWSTTQAAQISWRIELGGRVVGIREDVGPVLRLAVPEIAAGQRGRVVPFHAAAGDGPSWEATVASLDAVAATPPAVPIVVGVRQDGKKWWARVNEDPEFVVGQEFRLGSRRGLFNSADPIGPFYRGADWEAELGPWARLLEPTVQAEGAGNLVALNTWDSARFTFGCVQFAAHTPDDNFILLLRALLALPRAGLYFPELSLAGGRVHHRDRGLLETAQSTAALRDYLNPEGARIDLAEVEAAARLMHWTRADPAAVRAQVELAARKLRRYAARKAADLDGQLDSVCLLTWDIAHHGRAGKNGYAKKVQPALAAADPEAALLTIGADAWSGRIATLRREIDRLKGAGVLGVRRYDRASGDLVPA